MNNKRGEVLTITVIALATLCGLVGLWFGQTPYAKALGLGATPQKIQQTSKTITESHPVFVTDSTTGKQYVLQATKTETSTLDTTETPKMTLWQKLMMLPKLWLLLMVLGIFFPPVAAFMGYINKTLGSHLKKIVGGVEESLNNTTPEAKQKILDTLSKKYDSSTKLLVSKIKRKL
jgi:hypothetical protein